MLPVISKKSLLIAWFTDHWHSYNALDVASFSHYKINHSNHFADCSNHINGIEKFCNQAKSVLQKYNGMTEMPFHFLLKTRSIASQGFDLIMAAQSNS